MSTSTSLFYYDLPLKNIAQQSVSPRDSSRLLLLNRITGEYQHRVFREIIDELKDGDVLVLNDSKVFRARLCGKVRKREVEVFLLRPHGTDWEVMIRPARKVSVGEVINLYGLETRVKEKREDGTVILDFGLESEEIINFANKHGEIPVPPYVDQAPKNPEDYQTIYARETGSVAAPTAGFHFTDDLLQNIKNKGVEIHFVTLHVGLGTFQPMKTETLEEHQMHSEFVSISGETAQAINQAKQENRRVIAVGTTTVRTLEGTAALNDGFIPSDGFCGDVNLFITPGFDFKVINALITNFHLPQSTLLVLVSAFAGRDKILKAYQEAIDQGYRFYSFGDAMFIK